MKHYVDFILQNGPMSNFFESLLEHKHQDSKKFSSLKSKNQTLTIINNYSRNIGEYQAYINFYVSKNFKNTNILKFIKISNFYIKKETVVSTSNNKYFEILKILKNENNIIIEGIFLTYIKHLAGLYANFKISKDVFNFSYKDVKKVCVTEKCESNFYIIHEFKI
jgi:hypothetical protein